MRIIRHFEYNFLSASENNFKRNNIRSKLFNPIEHWNLRFITNLHWSIGDANHQSNCNFLFNDFKGSKKKLAVLLESSLFSDAPFYPVSSMYPWSIYFLDPLMK